MQRLRRGARLAPSLVAALAAHDWPGNARELQNVVTAVAASGPVRGLVTRQDVGALWAGPVHEAPPTLGEARRAFEHDYLVRLLRATEGNVTQAARMAQRNRTEFYKLLQRHNLTPALFKAEKEKA